MNTVDVTETEHSSFSSLINCFAGFFFAYSQHFFDIWEQTDIFMTDSKEYQIALESGNLINVGRIGNMLREQAKNVVYKNIIYT